MLEGSGRVGATLPPPPPPPPPPVQRYVAQPAADQKGQSNNKAPIAASPVQAGEQARAADEAARMAQLQRENFPAYVEALRPTLAPQDRDNPFAYSLDHAIPIEVKRQVYTEWRTGQNAPRVEIGSMSGNNATFDERVGANGTIRINGDLIKSSNDPRRVGQFEAFAVWGHMEEVGHWGDMRAHQIMGRPGGDSAGDEGARFAQMQVGGVAASAPSGSFTTNYDIRLSNGSVRSVTVDTVVLKALANEKLTNGSMARENRSADGVEHFGPEGHYQTTYITAATVARRSGMSAAEADQLANRMALGSQLPDMLSNYDAASQAEAKVKDLAKDAAETAARVGISTVIPGAGLIIGKSGPSRWTPAEQRHLEEVYEGLHALPRSNNATPQWLANERQETAAFISDRIAAGDYLTAGVATHRYGDLHAHVSNGVSFSGDVGHGLAGHAPDYLYTEDRAGRATSWNKAIEYQQSLANVIGDGVARRQANLGYPITNAQKTAAVQYGIDNWRGIYDRALSGARSDVRSAVNQGIYSQVPGSSFLKLNAKRATEVYFQTEAQSFIEGFHQAASGKFPVLRMNQSGTDGGYAANNNEINSLETVMKTFRAQ